MIQQNSLETLPPGEATCGRSEIRRSHPLFAHFEGLAARLRSPLDSPEGALQAIGITSCGRDHGVSTVSSNLAMAFQLKGHQTVLVDAHLAHPAIADSMAIPFSPGLCDFLDGMASLSDCLHGGSQENPTIMPAGTASDDAALTLEAADTSDLVAELRDGFDLIVVDLPPVEETAGCPALASQLDGVLLVVAADRVTASEVRRAIERLHRGGANLLGIVLNGYRQHVPGWLHQKS